MPRREGAARALLTALLLGAAAILPPAAAGQVSAVGSRSLSFGTVIPGVNTTVMPGATNTSASWDVDGLAGHKNVVISFLLPAALENSWGARMPLLWNNAGYAAACLSGRKSQCRNSTWNPTVAQAFSFPQPWNDGTMDVYLGGQVQPAANQGGGVYRGTVTLVVTLPNV